MFTGIIESTGTVKTLALKGTSADLEVQVLWKDLSLGESIAVDGTCLTVASIAKGSFTADVSAESLQRTIIGSYRSGRRVNLERALRLGDRLGGHLVYGHIDGVGRIAKIIKRGDCWDIEVAIDSDLRRYMADKASVAVNGISLTVARRLASGFGLAIVPHTLRATTIGFWRTGDRINVEVDMVAKYLDAMTGKR